MSTNQVNTQEQSQGKDTRNKAYTNKSKAQIVDVRRGPAARVLAQQMKKEYNKARYPALRYPLGMGEGLALVLGVQPFQVYPHQYFKRMNQRQRRKRNRQAGRH